MPAHARAPPLAEVLRPRLRQGDLTPDARRRLHRRTALLAGIEIGLLWTVALWTLRTTTGSAWQTAAFWSLTSGVLVGRATQALVWRLAQRWLGECRFEFGPADLVRFRERIPRALRWYGYQKENGSLVGDRYTSRFRALFGPVELSWQGAGARVKGPRWIVRKVVLVGIRC